jgi:hypothetical protein
VSDDELLERLRVVADEADPVPDEVLGAARAALGWRRVDAELLELVDDSLLEAGSGTRDGSGMRLLGFASAAGDCVVELQVKGTTHRSIVGQIDPPAADAVRLRHAGGVATAGVDDVGRFEFRAVAPGPAALSWTTPEGRRAGTAWVTF